MKPLINFVAILGLLSYSSPLSKPKAAPLQIFHSAGELSKKEDNGFVAITTPLIAVDQRIKLTYKDHRKERIADKDLWGYSDEEGTLYRHAEGVWEEVVAKENDLVIYKHHAKYGSVYSFSKGFDGELYRCKMMNLSKINAKPGDYSKPLLDTYF